jgi:hypothetical protein
MDSSTKSPAERLVAHSFRLDELRVLFENVKFRALVSEMKSIEDAAKVVEFGAKCLEEQKARMKREGINAPNSKLQIPGQD